MTRVTVTYEFTVEVDDPDDEDQIVEAVSVLVRDNLHLLCNPVDVTIDRPEANRPPPTVRPVPLTPEQRAEVSQAMREFMRGEAP